jgi:hypothetical protein
MQSGGRSGSVERGAKIGAGDNKPEKRRTGQKLLRQDHIGSESVGEPMMTQSKAKGSEGPRMGQVAEGVGVQPQSPNPNLDMHQL